MKYNELFTGDNLLFTNIFKNDFPDDYKTIFGERLPHVYDVVASLKFGNKELVSYLTSDNCKDVIDSLITANVENWVNAAKTMETEYDALNPVRRTVKTDVSGTEKQTSNDNDTQSIKAFNDTDFTPDNKNESNTDRDITTANNTVQTVSGYENGDIQDKLQKDFAFRLDNWRESIIFALIKEITLDIY